MRIRFGWAAGVLALALTSAVYGQDPPPKKVTFTGDIGFVNTAGNTEVTTLSLGDKLTYRAGILQLTQTFALVYGRSEGVQNANSQNLRGRADFFLVERLSVYGYVGYERNRFAGIARRTDEGAGLAFAALKTGRHELDLEAGGSLVQERRFPDPALDATVGENFLAGRGALRYKLLLGKNTWFQQSLEYLPNLEDGDDYRFNSETALVAPISSHFGLKAGYLIKYNNAPPAAGLAKTDRMLTTGLQISY
jgi:putative salt-induced outer membrane protein